MNKAIVSIKHLLAAALVLFVLAINANAQNRAVSGIVRFQDSSPVPGAFIYVKSNTSIGTTSDVDGRWSLSVPPDAVLVFSFIGTKTQEVPVGNRSTIDVVLENDTEMIDEMVVIGYGSVKKSDLTGAVSVVKTAHLQSSVFKLSKDLIDSIHEEGIVAYTS